MLDTTVLCHQQVPSQCIHRSESGCKCVPGGGEPGFAPGFESLVSRSEVCALDRAILCDICIHNSRSVPRGTTHGCWLLIRVARTEATQRRAPVAGSAGPFARVYVYMYT